MNWFKEAAKGIGDAAVGVGKALDPTGDDFLDPEKLIRGNLALGSMGTSELVRAGAKQLKGATDVKPADWSRLADEEARMQENRNWLKDLYGKAGERTAPQAAAPTDISRAGVRDVQATPLGAAPQATAAQIDPRAMQMTYDAAQGLAPSAAQAMLQSGVSQAGQLGMALAGARGGYNPAAIRGAQREMSASVQNAAAQSAALRAQEMQQARQEFSNLASYSAQLGQQAELFNKTQEGQFKLAEAENALRAQAANQAVDLDVLKTNAARGDAFALANLQAQLQQSGMNDAMQLAYVAQITGIDATALATEMARINADQQRRMIDMQTKMGLFSGVLGAGAQAGAAMATGGASLAAPAAAGAAGAATSSMLPATSVPMQGAGYTPTVPSYQPVYSPGPVTSPNVGGPSDWRIGGGK